MFITQITDQEFERFRKLIYEIAGISLSSAKKPLVTGRLSKRLRHFNLESFADYYRMVTGGEHAQELQTMVDLLTTNETYFFREEKHFDYIINHILPKHDGRKPFRVWSAASSTGEEAYSTSMVLHDKLGQTPWEIIASDISTRVLETAQAGLYRMEAAEKIPKPYLGKYCLKGVRTQAGWFMVDPELRKRVSFRQINLMENMPSIGQFDLIFLRNVMIYFDEQTKKRLVEEVMYKHLATGGHLFVGHSETLNTVTKLFRLVVPAVYRKD